MVNYIHKNCGGGGGGARHEKRGWEKGVGGDTGGCVGVCLQTIKCRVKWLGG